MISYLRKIPVKRILFIAAVTLAAILLLMLFCLAFLPTLVSSTTVQTRLQHTLSSSMKRQVSWSKLSLTWSDGVTLSNLKLGDGPAPLLKTNIEQLFVSPGITRGTDGRIGVDLEVKIKNVQVELAPGPPKAVSPPTKDPLTLLAEAIQKVQGLDFPLPVDLRVSIEAAPIQVVYRVPAKQLRLQDFSVRMAMPSLASQPVTAELNGRVLVDNREMGHVRLNARVSDLVTKAKRIRLASALFAVDATAPGTSLSVNGGLSQEDGFTARWKLGLPEVLAVAHPFLSPATPKVEGKVELLLRAKTDAKRDLHAAVTLEGAGLAAKGGSLKAKRVGPLDIKLQQQIVTDHGKQRVNFSGGKLAVPGLIDALWSATVDRPSESGRVLDLQLGPARLDLARALSIAKPFLPNNTPVKELSGELILRSLHLQVKGPAQTGSVALTGLGVKLPRFRLAQKIGELSAENVQLTLEKMECPLVAKQPTKVTADLLWSITRLTRSGVQPLILQGAHGTMGLAVSELNLKSTSPRKIAATAQLTQTLDLDHATLGTRLVIEKGHHQLRFLVRADERGDIEASLPEFSVNIASLQATQSGKKMAPLPLSASLTAERLQLSAGSATKPMLRGVVAHVSAGEVLQLAGNASLSGASPQQITTNGTARLDLQRGAAFAAPFMPSGFTAAGIARADWDFSRPLQVKVSAPENHPLRSAKAAVSHFDTLVFGLKLENVSATVPSDNGAIRVSGLHTKPDLRIAATKKGTNVQIDGGVLFSAVSGLPGAAGTLPAQRGSFVFNGELVGWREFRLSEELRIDPLAVSHEGELSISRIDALLEEKQPFNTATLIKRLDATLFATIDGAFTRQTKPLLPGTFVSGDISSSARVDLSAGRELALRYSLKTKNFDAQLANGTKIEGLYSDIALQRVYALASAHGDKWTPLSAALVRPSATVQENPGAVEIVGRITNDLRGDIRGSRSFSIRRVTTQASGVPLVISSLEGDLLFNQEKTGLSFLQADLLGGTILARSVFDLKPEIPVIVAASSFSNLDITQLVPKDAKSRGVHEDAEVTGEMSLTAPLTTEQRELFEQLRLALNIRKIGANTIERALFSIDPYERNEQLVAQRKMLRLGSLKGLRANAVDGAFSMEGEARIKGVAVDLPKVDRLRISELPLRQELTKNREKIIALRRLFDLVRADILVVGEKGELKLKRRNYAQ